MSAFHVVILAMVLICLEARTNAGASIAFVLSAILFVDLAVYILLGATPLTIIGVLSTWLVWNVKGESIPALPYKFVWLVYLVMMVRAALQCSEEPYDGSLALCWSNNTSEFRTTLASGIFNSGLLALFRF